MVAIAQTVQASAVAVRASGAARPALRASFAGLPLRQKATVARANQRAVARAASSDFDVDEIVKDLGDKWESVENKPGFIAYSVGGFMAVWLSSTVVNAVGHLPLLPKVFELVGLGYTAWFTYRYLLFESSRKELMADVDALKRKVLEQ